MSEHDHTDLISAREGNITALQSLLQNHQRSLYRVAYSILLDPELARSAIQDALLSAIYSPGKHIASEPFEIWLKSLVVRACRGLASNRARAKPALKPPTGQEVSLWDAYRMLSADYQIPLALHYFHGYKIDQVAQLMRVGPSTVYTRLASARGRIMASLSQNGPLEPPPGDDAAGASASLIGHDQARYLLQSELDGHLTAKEWVPLQSHLDHCESCRSFRKRLHAMERDLQHALRAHLEAPGDIAPLDPEKLLARQRAGLRSRNILRSAAKTLGSVVSLAIGLYLAYAIFIPEPVPSLTGTQTAEAVLGARATPTTAPTPTPPLAEPFRTPVVFQSNRDGNNEIYLLETDGQAVNLTRNPASDTLPVWSPDGEWIAFYSDRSGKNEIYLLHISGSRLVQVTSEAGVEWQGPVSWSAGGAVLAAAGAWDQDNGRSWIYLVDLKNDNEVVRLSFTRDGQAPRFAAGGDLLVYQVSGAAGTYLVTRKISEYFWSIIVNGQWNDGGEVLITPPGGFDWSPVGDGLLYISDGPYRYSTQGQTQSPLPGLSSKLNINPFVRSSGVSRNPDTAWTAPTGRKLASASWSPGGLLAFLQEGDEQCAGENRWTIGLFSRPQGDPAGSRQDPAPSPLTVPGLCAAASLTDSTWSPDGRWLVLNAGSPGHSGAALYALDVLKSMSDLARDPTAPLALLRLTEPGGQDTAPQVRPRSAQLGIAPIQVEPAARPELLPPASIQGAPGEIIYSAAENDRGAIYSFRPDADSFTRLASKPGTITLLAVQKGDPGWIAFSSTLRNSRGPEEIFVMGPHGASVVQVTSVPTDQRPYATLSYGPFAWSPDGSSLAVEVFNQNGKYLAVLPSRPSAGESESRYIQLQGDQYTRPVWLSEGKKIYMASSGSGMGLVIVDPQADPLDAVHALRMDWPESSWGRIYDMIELTPTGRLAFLTSRKSPTSTETTYEVFTGNARGDEITLQATAQVSQQSQLHQNSEISWLEGPQKILWLITSPADRKFKSTFTLVDLAGGSTEPLWQSEDYIFHHLVSPDGKWILYTTESGLWAVNIEETQAGKSGPVHVVDAAVSGFDWRP